MHTREYEELNQMILALQRQVRTLSVTGGGGGGSGAPNSASYVVMGLSGSLTSERRLVAGTGIIITDGGANGNVEIAADFGSPPIQNPAPSDASYVTLGLDSSLTAERRLIAGDGILITDGGPNGTVEIAVNLGSPFGLGGSGALVLLEQHTASSSASLDFTTRNASGMSGATIQSDFDDYLLEVIGLLPSADATLDLFVSGDGGGTWESTSYFYTIRSLPAGGSPINSGSGSDSKIQLAGTVESTTSTSFCNVTVQLYNPGSSTRQKGFNYHSVFLGNDTNKYDWIGMCGRASTSAINAIQLKYDSSANCAEGVARIYGLAKS